MEKKIVIFGSVLVILPEKSENKYLNRVVKRIDSEINSLVKKS